MKPRHSEFEYFDDKYSFNKIQIAFCVDTTGSMDVYIEQVKKAITNITEHISISKFYQFEFAFVGYRDYPKEENIYVVKTSGKQFLDENAINTFIEDEIDADNGGDFPEAVLDGLDACANKLDWKDKAVKYVFHIADAPPHGDQYNDGEYLDTYSEGNPGGLELSSVARDFKNKGLNYVLLECVREDHDVLRKMKYIFADKSHFGRFKSYELAENFKVMNALADTLQKAFRNEKEMLRHQIKKDLRG